MKFTEKELRWMHKVGTFGTAALMLTFLFIAISRRRVPDAQWIRTLEFWGVTMIFATLYTWIATYKLNKIKEGNHDAEK